MLSYHLIVSGDVQGVGFRGGAARTATRLGLRGWVKNNNDGTVESIVQGPKEACEEYIDWCKKGSVSSRVHAVHVEKTEEDMCEGFEILQ